ncbi:class I adenylate-forming enzyme family protein [Chromobacterium sp. IIBBL 290-4]|uniref:class I adenylate-forming enzyme family protein n=1 Tax=Chromobacterium sp. IIBBL 290-4 TaxID=2953890 RepID=UPI0020B8F0C6|nr:class I adenylate-forming enzyme family protein [Chromobacterium sp. IIBBL 290-4]UTH76457.1 acyl--CoA ligase [Chromobacterium sp. IIBBL 290-4]
MPHFFHGQATNICHRLKHICQLNGERAALCFPDRDSGRLSYAQLFRSITEAAYRLHSFGIGTGSRVMLCLDNQPELVVLAFACGYLGAVGVVANNRLGKDELDYQLRDAQVGHVVTSSDYLALFEDHAHDLDYKVIVCDGENARTAGALPKLPLVENLAASTRVWPIVEVSPSSPALIFYTSGTTSHPKGVVISHALISWAADRNIASLGVGASDATLVFFPLHHTLGFSYQLLTSLFSGGLTVLRRVFNPARFWDDAEHFQCTWAAILPFVCHALTAFPIPERHSFKFWGFPSRNKEVEVAFKVRTTGWWGMTELFAIGCVTAHDGDDPNYSVGSPVPNIRYRLADTVPEGGPFDAVLSGELQIAGESGQSLFSGYLNKPEETAQAFSEDGWFRTGDRFFQSAEGILFFDVRLKDIIKVGGENVSSAEIEFAAFSSGLIKEVAVIAAPDPLWVEVPVVFAVLNEQGRSDEASARVRIMDTCHQRLADFKQPRHVFFLDDFPRAGMGKIAKNVLRGMVDPQTLHSRVGVA